MSEIDERVREETSLLLIARTRVLATVVLLGIVAGVIVDISLGRLSEYPYRAAVEIVGLLAMLVAIVSPRWPGLVRRPQVLACSTTWAACIFLLSLSVDSGPNSVMVVVVAYTVLNLGAAILLPWGLASQFAMVCVVFASSHASFYLLGETLFLDPSVYCAFFAGLMLSLFVAIDLERSRVTLARQRFELAEQKEAAEQQKAAAEHQKGVAEALARDLDSYAHAVAHDLKNPINVISGYTDLLESKIADSLDDDGRHFLAQTAKGCSKMVQIIDELLLLASVRKIGKVPQEPLDMSKVVDETCQRLSQLIEDARAEVVLPEQWPQAVGHAPWVEEVWANYISNAIKYGGAPPRVELGADTEHHGMIHFWVRDNGQGLAEDELGRLFQEFARVNAVKADGHGLGLSIVKRIVEKLGGEVRVASRMGDGSTFGFTLPTRGADLGANPERR